MNTHKSQNGELSASGTNFFENTSNICFDRTKDNSNKLDKNDQSQLSEESQFKVPKMIMKGRMCNHNATSNQDSFHLIGSGLSSKYLAGILL